MSKKLLIAEARIDPIKAGRFLEQDLGFRGPEGDILLSALSDCIVAAHRAKIGKATANGASKWSVTLGWHQGNNSGLLALNFGNDYLCLHSNRYPGVLRVCYDIPELEDLLNEGEEIQFSDGYHHLPDSGIVSVDPDLAGVSWERFFPAFALNCDKASQVWSKLHARSYGAHAPGLLEYLRLRLNRDIPDPAWSSEEFPC